MNAQVSRPSATGRQTSCVGFATAASAGEAQAGRVGTAAANAARLTARAAGPTRPARVLLYSFITLVFLGAGALAFQAELEGLHTKWITRRSSCFTDANLDKYAPSAITHLLLAFGANKSCAPDSQRC